MVGGASLVVLTLHPLDVLSTWVLDRRGRVQVPPDPYLWGLGVDPSVVGNGPHPPPPTSRSETPHRNLPPV